MIHTSAITRQRVSAEPEQALSKEDSRKIPKIHSRLPGYHRRRANNSSSSKRLLIIERQSKIDKFEFEHARHCTHADRLQEHRFSCRPVGSGANRDRAWLVH